MIRRCSHGFPAGMCRCPVCPAFEGDIKLTATAPRCCDNCGRVTTKHTLCDRCSKDPALNHRRRVARGRVEEGYHHV